MFLPAVLAVLAALTASCASSSPTPTTSGTITTAATTSVPSPVGGFGRKTNVPIVDQIISDVAQRDTVALHGLVKLVALPCVAQTGGAGLGGLICRSGEQPGTQVSVLPVTRDQGSYLRVEDIEPELKPYIDGATGVKMAYETTPQDGGGPSSPYQAGKYAIVFTRSQGPSFKVIADESGILVFSEKDLDDTVPPGRRTLLSP